MLWIGRADEIVVFDAQLVPKIFELSGNFIGKFLRIFFCFFSLC